MYSAAQRSHLFKRSHLRCALAGTCNLIRSCHLQVVLCIRLSRILIRGYGESEPVIQLHPLCRNTHITQHATYIQIFASQCCFLHRIVTEQNRLVGCHGQRIGRDKYIRTYQYNTESYFHLHKKHFTFKYFLYGRINASIDCSDRGLIP